MDIQRKIEEIRQKPEHIRMRYVWMCTAVGMVIVIIVWVISLSVQLRQEQKSSMPEMPNHQEFLDQMKQQAESLKNVNDQAKGMLNNNANTNNSQNEGFGGNSDNQQGQ